MSQLLVIENNGKYKYFENTKKGRTEYCNEMRWLLNREFFVFEIDRIPLSTPDNRGGIEFSGRA